MTARRAVIAAVWVVATAALSGCGPGGVVAEGPAGQAPSTGATSIGDVFGAGCAHLPQGDQAGSLSAMAHQSAATAIATNPQLSGFATALRSTAVDTRLNGDRGLTVFVPDNNALEKLHHRIGDDAFSRLRDNYDQGSFLSHHIVNRRMSRGELTAAGSVQTLDGDRLSIAVDGPTITVSDPGRQAAQVVCGDIPTANATLFIIDTVLVSPESLLAHETRPDPVHCAPNPGAHNGAELCFDTSHSADTPR